ncbi:MAG: universal stress protein [Methyloprofundus sp.]|nr:universal stress protein [Methyloprofundus sp.]
MNNYQHILLAADFSEHGLAVAQKAQQLAKQHQAKLSVIHIIDNLPISDTTYGPIIPFDMDLSDLLMTSAKKQLAKLAQSLNIPEQQQYLETGSAYSEIVSTAEEHNVDLIVLGSHGRHGLALLLGSTANSVLHHAKCDVLAVRLQDK